MTQYITKPCHPLPLLPSSCLAGELWQPPRLLRPPSNKLLEHSIFPHGNHEHGRIRRHYLHHPPGEDLPGRVLASGFGKSSYGSSEKGDTKLAWSLSLLSSFCHLHPLSSSIIVLESPIYVLCLSINLNEIYSWRTVETRLTFQMSMNWAIGSASISSWSQCRLLGTATSFALLPSGDSFKSSS